MSKQQLKYHLLSFHSYTEDAADSCADELFGIGETRTNRKGRFEVFIPRPDLWPEPWTIVRQSEHVVWKHLWSWWSSQSECDEEE